LIQIYGIILAYSFTETAFTFFEVKTAFIYIGDEGNCLSEIYMYCFVFGYLLVKIVRIFNRAVLYTGCTTPASVFNDVPWFLS